MKEKEAEKERRDKKHEGKKGQWKEIRGVGWGEICGGDGVMNE